MSEAIEKEAIEVAQACLIAYSHGAISADLVEMTAETLNQARRDGEPDEVLAKRLNAASTII